MPQQEIKALKVKQWIDGEWDQVLMEESMRRRPPPHHFYIFSISAYDLKKLSGIYRRGNSERPAEDIGIQRQHIKERSREILRYVRDGFPLSRIKREKLLDPNEAPSLKMPGWIPTSIVANILIDRDTRGPNMRHVDSQDLLQVDDISSDMARIVLPQHMHEAGWKPVIHPIEIIDGQHRLWAFEDENRGIFNEEFMNKLKSIEIPVVAFVGLDISWQAYLFYTINQLPKKIDKSMVFDLYPLLRTEDWLLRFEGAGVYREARAQDLTTIMWMNEESPWHDRILRFGRERGPNDGIGRVTQASFIRNLLSTFIRPWIYKEYKRIGGLFGAPLGRHNLNLSWSREQQGAFLITIWKILRDEVIVSESVWANHILELERQRIENSDQAGSLFDDFDEDETNEVDRNVIFSGKYTILATDQGVRGYMSVINDILFIAEESGITNLSSWIWDKYTDIESNDNKLINEALAEIEEMIPGEISIVRAIANCLASFDWRLSSALNREEDVNKYNQQSVYRGGVGYGQIRINLLEHLKNNAADRLIMELAQLAIDKKIMVDEGDLEE